MCMQLTVRLAVCSFHKRCFVCDRCKNAFEGGVFFEHEGRPFCKRHHLELFCAPCNKCKGPVEVGVTLEGRTYHTEHFVCDDCGVSVRVHMRCRLLCCCASF